MSDEIIATTRKWLERAVIDLNLCLFAKSVHVKRQVRYVVSAAQTEEALLDDLERELKFLIETAPYPILHLLREASLARATAAFPDAAEIYERNIETLRELGLDSWRALDVDAPAKRKP